MRPITVEDYERMVDAGIFGDDDRVELLNGQLSEKTPLSPEHAEIVRWLTPALIRGIDPEVADVGAQLPLRLPPLSSPSRTSRSSRRANYAHAHPTEALLVIEVSVSSRRLDLGTKAEIYAAAGVAGVLGRRRPGADGSRPRLAGGRRLRVAAGRSRAGRFARPCAARRRSTSRSCSRCSTERRRSARRGGPKAAPWYRVAWCWECVSAGSAEPLRSPSCLALPLPLPDFA